MLLNKAYMTFMLLLWIAELHCIQCCCICTGHSCVNLWSPLLQVPSSAFSLCKVLQKKVGMYGAVKLELEVGVLFILAKIPCQCTVM